MEKSCVHLYWGEGKGKTTAAMGLALRALGNDRQVVIVQFLKGRESGEIALLRKLGATVLRCKAGQRFAWQMTEKELNATREMHNDNLREAVALPSDLLVLDEACAACELGLLDEELLRQAVLERPAHREVVLTGRNPKQWLSEAADYSTEMHCHKHPFTQGVAARQGIEY